MTCDPALVGGSEEDVSSFLDNSEEPFHVDWREDEADVVAYVAERIPRQLGAVWADDPVDLVVTYEGRSTPLGLKLAPSDRSRCLARLNEIIGPDFEIRAFSQTIATSDTISFYVKPRSWWDWMGAEFPEQVARVFTRISPEIDLFALAL
jgi:hypothetical protein